MMMMMAAMAPMPIEATLSTACSQARVTTPPALLLLSVSITLTIATSMMLTTTANLRPIGVISFCLCAYRPVSRGLTMDSQKQHVANYDEFTLPL